MPISLHPSPLSLSLSLSLQLLVLNSQLNGQFQRPIPLRDRTFPTVPGQNTTITILAAEEEFELYARQAGEPLYQTTYSYTRDSGAYLPVETVTRIETPQRNRNPTVYLMAGRVYIHNQFYSSAFVCHLKVS